MSDKNKLKKNKINKKRYEEELFKLQLEMVKLPSQER
jgi:hypothetical protein